MSKINRRRGFINHHNIHNELCFYKGNNLVCLSKERFPYFAISFGVVADKMGNKCYNYGYVA
ncbi:hypothetical protein CKY04_01915 [Photorhabdus sp. S8-52]|nr:hypothetical protein CKY05_01915 [Photorhabdus sp. S10-54]RAX06036.1 hypothetical protein CKY04_01915 [Photorhabdus sp. S8-52]